VVHLKSVKSPCVGVCSTGIGDSVCRGCKRYMHEIVDWNAYSAEERASVIGRISNLVQQVAEPVIEIVDVEQFHQALKYQHVRFDELAGPYVWLLEELREQIDKDFFTLSQVHYERYFPQHKSKS